MASHAFFAFLYVLHKQNDKLIPRANTLYYRASDSKSASMRM